MSDNQYFSERESSVFDPHESGSSRPFPQELSSQVPGSGLLMIRSAEVISSRREFPPRNLPASNTRIVNQLISSGMEGDVHQEIHLMEQLQKLNITLSRSSEDTHLGCELSSSRRRDGIELLSTERYGDDFISNVLPSERYADISIDKEFPSSRPAQDYLREDPLDKRVSDIANQLLLANEENNQHAGNSDFASYLSLNDISIEYWQLYAKTRPENYDFAMNIMAYIELLNDCSWKATVSYFDENVKRMVKYIWNEKQVSFNNMIDLQRFNREMIIQLMYDFTQWSIESNFDLNQFLNYCILLCQLGAIARKYIFKEAPLYAIGQLRERIKFFKFEHFVQFMNEIVFKEYAKRLIEHSRL